MKFSEIRSAVTDRLTSVRDWIGDNVIGEERDYGAGGADGRMRDYAVLGGAAGAAVGGAAGTALGFQAQAADTIREEWVPRSIEDPSLAGYHESITPDIERTCTTEWHTDSDGNRYSTETCTERTRGYWHNFSPRIDHPQVGEYTEPRFVHGSFWEPLGAGVAGALLGGVTGVALGAGIAGLGGVALSQISNVGPDMGQGYIVDSFMVVVVGGVGQLAGAVWAALGLGIFSKLLEGWVGAVIAKIAILVAIIVFIQKRPQGIFALKGRFVE